MTFFTRDADKRINTEVRRRKDIRGRIYFLLWLMTNLVGTFLVVGFAQRLRDQNYANSTPDIWGDWNFMVAALVVTFTLSLIWTLMLVRLNTLKGDKSIRDSVTGAMLEDLEDEMVFEKAKRLLQVEEDGEIMYSFDYDDAGDSRNLYSKEKI